jgi:hypothetical protein
MDKKIKVDFIRRARQESAAEQLLAQLFSEELDANTTHGVHSFHPPPEAPAVAPEKALVTSVLKQAARDIRRFRNPGTRLEREVYRDAYDWITSPDISWPFSFLNVCHALGIDAESTRYELLVDAELGLFSYWIRRGGRFARAVGSSVTRVLTRNNPVPANAWTTPPLQAQ